MFTGLIEEIGIVKSVTQMGLSAKITIQVKKILDDIKIGDSISTNGVCLTVVDLLNSSFSVDVMPETMKKSNLKGLIMGSKVNLERALQIGDRLHGHFVSGHIDGVGYVRSFHEEDNAVWITIGAEKSILKYVVYKGSIAIDGISLTVAYVDEEVFKVSIIPHTGQETTLLSKKKGDEINLECDMIGKYLAKFMKDTDSKLKNDIDKDFLKENGFI